MRTHVVSVSHDLYGRVFAMRNRRPEWVRVPIAAGTSASGRTVLVSGATGFIGGHLVRRLVARGDQVMVLTRDADRALDRFGAHVRIVTRLGDVDPGTRIDAIVNLAGARILGLPWTKARRHKLRVSRIETTRALVDLCARLPRPPLIFISASAVGYYGIRGDEPVDEQEGPQPIFQSQLCQEWEAAADEAGGIGARVVKLRIGPVLGRDGGALPQLAVPVRLGLGAVLGSGGQWMSWIHIDDLISLFDFALDTPELRGVLNAVSPGAVTHAQMQHAIARALHRPLWLRVPAVAVRAGAGEMAQLLVDGQHVVPARALASGFRFRYPHLNEALADLLGSAHERF